ncbi:substrate-binding domain-containing protein [Lachnospiraceae bacterium 47-T17]
MKKGYSFVLMLMFLLFLWGSAGRQDQQAPVGEADVACETFPEQENNGKPDIYLITKGYGSDYWDTLRQGARDAAAAYGCNLYVGGTPSESHLELLAELMQDALERGADAILVSPADVAQIKQMATKVKRSGVPLIFVDTILNAEDFDACFATDNMEAGRLAAQETIRLLQKAGKSPEDAVLVGIDISSAQSQTILERLAGFQEYWSNGTPSTWKVIDDIRINGGDLELAKSQCLEYMDSYMDLAAVVGLNNGSTVGLARALLERKRTDLVLVGFDYSEEMRTLIGGGAYFAASIVQRQYDMGYEGVALAVRLLAGGAVSCRYVDTGVQQVDHDNVNSPYIQKILVGE